MKQNRKIIILAVLFVITSFCGILLSSLEDKKDEEQPETKAIITEISAGDVQAVMLKNATGTVGLLNLADGIIVDGADARDYSQSKLITLIYTLSHLTAERTLELPEPEFDPESYGLAEPSAQASLLLQNGTIRLLLGRKSPVSDLYYIQVEGEPTVYMISSETADLMLQSVSDLRDLSMYPMLTRDTLKQLSQIAITNPDGRIVLQQHSTDTVSSFFGMTEPVTAALNWERVDTTVLNPVRALFPKHYVSDDEPLSTYGLDNPDYILELTIAGQTYTCGFAQKSPDSWYCANLSGTLVSEVDASAITFLQTNFMDLIGDSIYTVSVADISRLSAKSESGTVSLELTGESTALAGVTGSRQMDYLEVLDFYKKIDSIPAAAMYQETELLASSPILTLTVSLRNGKEDILEFYSISDRQCAVYVNGICEFTTYTTVVTDIMDAFDKLDS